MADNQPVGSAARRSEYGCFMLTFILPPENNFTAIPCPDDFDRVF